MTESKQKYVVIKDLQCRVSGLRETIGVTSFYIESKMMNISSGTQVTIYEYGVNEFHPQLVKAYVPDMNCYIDRISVCHLECTK